jgi:hypothetical protein
MTTTSTRALRDAITNILDFLVESELALYANPVAFTPTRVTFHRHDPDAPFLADRKPPSIEHYRAWIDSGTYSAILFDGALMQMTYDIEGGNVVGHRLAYVPCPYALDPELIEEGVPIGDIVELHEGDAPILASPIRFDFDPGSARIGHPPAHLTVNGADCRIAIVAAMHPMQFVDFVFRNFYPSLWKAQAPFFIDAAMRQIPHRITPLDEPHVPHLAWTRGSASARPSTVS